jgi:hypothetical protein
MILVERFFAQITMKRIRRGVFRSVGELEDAIRDYLDQHNADPKPFVWTKTANAVLAKERRALEKLQNLTGRSQPTVRTLAVVLKIVESLDVLSVQ